MEILINANQQGRRVTNFWNNFHFHPTDAIEDNWGRNILDRVSKDKVANCVRMYTMFEDMVTLDNKGDLKFDFTLNDQRIDYMMEKGFDLLICFNFMPAAIAENPLLLSKMPRYKGKRFNFSKPKDYKLWQEVCFRYTEHVIERYGISVVKNWFFHCWNEPDHGYWLNDNGGSTPDEDKIVEYAKLYDHFAAGIMRASKEMRFGGPSAAVNLEFIEKFIEHTKSGINDATGEVGVRFDFLTIHTYGGGPWTLKEWSHPSITKILDQTEHLYSLLKKYGYEGKDMIVDEWAPLCQGFTGTDVEPQLEIRDNEYSSAFFAKVIDVYIRELYKRQIPLKKMLICMAGQHNLTKDFEGYNNFFTLNEFKKPIYNGYALAAKLGDELLEVKFSEDDENVGVVATKEAGGNYKIMLYYMNEDFRKRLGTKRIGFTIENLSGEFDVRHYRVDHDVSNSYTKFKELGSPENPNQYQREQIKQAGKLSLLYPAYTCSLAGSYQEEIIMNQNAVSFIELIKK